MATYYHGNPELQSDGLQTLILMNPGYVGYSSDPQHHQPTPNNYVFLNSTGNSLALPHAPPSHAHQQYIAGVPLPASAAQTHQDPNEISALQHQSFMPRVQYNLWNPIEHSTEARDTPRSQQGLSLSLSSQHPHTAAAYGSYGAEREMAPQSPAVPPRVPGSDGMRISGGSSSPASGITNGVSGLQQSVLLSSKYLKAAQQLLEEVVNVGNYGIKSGSARNKRPNGDGSMIGEPSMAVGGGEGGTEAELTDAKGGAMELTTAERQEIQMKKAKLVGMLDEVEQRYRQYHHQMQIVISTFEQVAGIGSAKTYTALALQTISKQFRCLKDAITGQIRSANKTLGEEDSSGRIEGGSRLKFVDNQLRQQRALQQLGMIQQNAWRPQRGLPERSVSVLRAWLFEHFLHPYPKDSDKLLLAKQTGLTRSQVSNWFINARVRLWKPMVEEMYLEEIKEQEQNQSGDKARKSENNNEDSASKKTATAQQEKSPVTDNQANSFMSSASTSPSAGGGGGNSQSYSGFALTGSPVITQGSPKKPRSVEALFSSNTSVPSMGMDIKPEEGNNDLISSMKFGDHRQARDGYSLMSAATNYIGGFNSYPMGEMGRFDAEQFSPRIMGNGVSLTLGLPHCENLSLSGAHQNFLPNHNIQLGRRVDIGEANDFSTMGGATAVTPSHSTNAYEDLSIQNRKRFAAQLLPDFVA